MGNGLRRVVAWDEGRWLDPPLAEETDGGHLVVTARQGSDFWRVTGYGFVHDDGHALLVPAPAGPFAVEVAFLVDFAELYDQAGVLLRVDEHTWIKAGVEHNDGVPHVGAVVTHGRSDWSLAPVPTWAGREVTVRASREGDAVTVRARCGDGPWRMVRYAPLDADAALLVGPYCCAPKREGMRVRFTGFALGPADAALHPDD